MKELTCIVCPRGCRLKIDDQMNVTGNFCIRGKNYALEELSAPKRNISSSIRVSNREYTLVSVKTNRPIPKELIFKVMEEINKVQVLAPTKIGDVVIENVLNTGSDIVITKEIK